MRGWTGALLAPCCVLLAACGGGEAEGGATTKDDAPAVDLAVERTTTMLKPSEVRTVAIAATSGTGDGAAGSGPQEQVVAASQITQVQAILTEFGARRTAEGIVIDLPESILFDFDQSALRADAQAPLEKVARVIREGYPNAAVAIYGHTDAKGDDAYNQRLSQARADAVKQALSTRLGIDASRLRAEGLGEQRPVAPNARPDGGDDPAGRQKNRRVEVLIRGVQ